MLERMTRRGFVGTSVRAGAAAALGDFAFLGALPTLARADVQAASAAVRLPADIEPLVKLVEDTDRAKLMEAVVGRIKAGTSYQDVLAALLLSGVRRIRPRPVGFEFHCVLVVNSAHLAALASSGNDRWLPLLWALDNFKRSQQIKRDKGDGTWALPAVAEGRLAPPDQARRRFVEAMDGWNEDAADQAVVPLARSAGAGEVIELFWRYGMRDFRDIGHKAIYTANSWRTLQTVGWRHAEPVLRSLTYALLEYDANAGHPAKSDLEPDRPWRENQERAKKIGAGWKYGKPSEAAAADLLATLRTCSPAEASEKVVTLLNQGVAPASLWDGLFLTCGEILMRRPGIGGLHTVTATNALHYAYTASGNDETRRLAMLQAAAFLPMFRVFCEQRDPLKNDVRIDTLPRAEAAGTGPGGIAEVYAEVGKDTVKAAGKVLAMLAGKTASAADLMAAGRRLIFAKGNDSHDYKFSSAALEDYYHVSPAWRPRYLAGSLFWLKGTGAADNPLIQQVRVSLA